MKGTATPHEEGFVYIFGLMMKYFEMVGWEKRWRQSQKDLYKTIYQTIKNIKPNAEVERHIASNTTTVLRFVWCFHFFLPANHVANSSISPVGFTSLNGKNTTE